MTTTGTAPIQLGRALAELAGGAVLTISLVASALATYDAAVAAGFAPASWWSVLVPVVTGIAVLRTYGSARARGVVGSGSGWLVTMLVGVAAGVAVAVAGPGVADPVASRLLVEVAIAFGARMVAMLIALRLHRGVPMTGVPTAGRSVGSLVSVASRPDSVVPVGADVLAAGDPASRDSEFRDSESGGLGSELARRERVVADQERELLRREREAHAKESGMVRRDRELVVRAARLDRGQRELKIRQEAVARDRTLANRERQRATEAYEQARRMLCSAELVPIGVASPVLATSVVPESEPAATEPSWEH